MAAIYAAGQEYFKAGDVCQRRIQGIDIPKLPFDLGIIVQENNACFSAAAG